MSANAARKGKIALPSDSLMADILPERIAEKQRKIDTQIRNFRFGRRDLDADLITGICNVCRAGNRLQVAAEYHGVNPATLRRWMEFGESEVRKLQQDIEDRQLKHLPQLSKYAQLYVLVRRAIAEWEAEKVEQLNAAGAVPRNWGAALSLLERRIGEEWRPTQELDISGQVEHQHGVVRTIAIPEEDEDVQAYLKRRSKKGQVIEGESKDVKKS